MKRGFFVWAVALTLLTGCSATRLAYNNADSMLRFMVSDYFDPDPTQTEELNAKVARMHQWHRATELPVYAALLQSAGQRFAKGLTADDVAWGIAGVRARYRHLATRAVADVAPLLTTLAPDQLATIEKRFAINNAKYAREFLPADPNKRHKALAKRTLGRFSDWMGELSDEQEARIERFVREHQRYTVLRFEDRQRWQQDALALVRQLRDPQALAQRLTELFTRPDARRPEEFMREEKRWEEGLAQLILDLDRTLAPAQRAEVTKRIEGYVEDFNVLARRKAEST